MNIRYEIIPQEESIKCRELVNELMAYQKSLAKITPERFDTMSYESRMVPSISGARDNYIVLVYDEDAPVGYVYANICRKEVYDSNFAKFFEMDSVEGGYVGCLSQFYIKPGYRGMKIGSELFQMSMDWIKRYVEINDIFIYVSDGNLDAMNFYISKGFKKSHTILDGFITVLRNI